MSNDIWTLDDLKGRISSFYNEKKAAEEAPKEAANNDPVPEKDPQEESAPGVTGHDGDSAEKTQLPAAGLATQNSDGNADDGIPDAGEASGKKPNGAGEGGHSAADGDSKDDAVKSPTDESVAKTASKAKQLADAIKENILNKEAGDYKKGKKDEKKKEAEEDKEAKPLVGDQHKLPENLKDKIKAADDSSEEVQEDEAEKEASDIEAVASDFDEDKNAYQKIASLVMSFEEGRQMVSELADREFGKQAAEQLIKEAEEIEEYEQAMEEEQVKVASEVSEMLKEASEEDIADIEKMMEVHEKEAANFKTDEEVEAYDLGCKQAAMAMDAGGEMPLGAEGAEGGAGLEDVSLDEVAQVIMEMVESGELDPAMAEQILAELAGADAGGEGAMPEGAMPEGEPKMASIDDVIENSFKEEEKTES